MKEKVKREQPQKKLVFSDFRIKSIIDNRINDIAELENKTPSLVIQAKLLEFMPCDENRKRWVEELYLDPCDDTLKNALISLSEEASLYNNTEYDRVKDTLRSLIEYISKNCIVDNTKVEEYMADEMKKNAVTYFNYLLKILPATNVDNKDFVQEVLKDTANDIASDIKQEVLSYAFKIIIKLWDSTYKNPYMYRFLCSYIRIARIESDTNTRTELTKIVKELDVDE